MAMQVKDGTSRTVWVDASLPRISWTRSRKSATEFAFEGHDEFLIVKSE